MTTKLERIGRKTNKFIERQRKNHPSGIIPLKPVWKKMKITSTRPKVNPKPTGTKRPKKTKKSYG